MINKAANRYKEAKAVAAAKSTKEVKATTKAANRYFILLGSNDNKLNYIPYSSAHYDQTSLCGIASEFFHPVSLANAIFAKKMSS